MCILRSLYNSLVLPLSLSLSLLAYLQKPLESYIKTLTVPTRLLRMPRRSGLVPARLLGAENARGKVLTFLDAHCECSRGWLEPLLARIKEDKTVVVSPFIDVISDDNFSYTKSLENYWGAFNWQLNFRWYSQKRRSIGIASKVSEGKQDFTRPVPTPAMAGGLFAIDRKYFYEIGSYDKEMKVSCKILNDSMGI